MSNDEVVDEIKEDTLDAAEIAVDAVAEAEELREGANLEEEGPTEPEVEAEGTEALEDEETDVEKLESLKPLVEAIILAADEPITPARISYAIGERINAKGVRKIIKDLKKEYDALERGFYICDVAGGVQFRTRPEYSATIKKLFKSAPKRLSRPALETLSIVAYKQPVTRGEVEEVRGVDSGGVLKTLLERRFIKIVGRKEIPGRPPAYGTTKEFLEVFDLKDLSGLPSLKEIESLIEEEHSGDEVAGLLSGDKPESGEDFTPEMDINDTMTGDGGGSGEEEEGKGYGEEGGAEEESGEEAGDPFGDDEEIAALEAEITEISREVRAVKGRIDEDQQPESEPGSEDNPGSEDDPAPLQERTDEGKQGNDPDGEAEDERAPEGE